MNDNSIDTETGGVAPLPGARVHQPAYGAAAGERRPGVGYH